MEPGGFVDFLANGLQGLLLAYFYWRLKIKVYARWTAWGMYTILILGFWFVAVPRSFQIDWLTGYQPLIRFTIFIISAVFCAVDLVKYLKMTKEQREENKK